MTSDTLKRKIVSAIDNIDDEEFLKGIYTILNNKIGNTDFEYANELKEELEIRSQYIKEGNAKLMTVNEVKIKLIKKLVK